MKPAQKMANLKSAEEKANLTPISGIINVKFLCYEQNNYYIIYKFFNVYFCVVSVSKSTIRRYSLKKLLWKIYQISQYNTYAEVFSYRKADCGIRAFLWS